MSEPMAEAREAELMQRNGELEQELAQLRQQLAKSGTRHLITAYTVLYDKTMGEVFPLHLPMEFEARAEMARALRMASAGILEGLK